MNESMARLVWDQYQYALADIRARDNEIDQLNEKIAGLLSQARDYKARVRILAKRCKDYEKAFNEVHDNPVALNAKDVLPAAMAATRDAKDAMAATRDAKDSVYPPAAYYRQRRMSLSGPSGWDIITHEDRQHWIEQHAKALEG